MTDSTAKKHSFQTEVKQLMHLMIHSLYSHKDIFLRELISNASDACDKLRFESLSKDNLLENDKDLNIKIDFDPKKHTLTITDNGIGMNEEDIINNLGTIAKSGTANFLEKLSGDQKKDAQLIGQFGVGFYSSFMVADKVEVISRKAGKPPETAVQWVSNGEGEFTVTTTKQKQRGTTIILYLKKEATDYVEASHLKFLIKKYSDHISIPVLMKEEVAIEEKDEKQDEQAKKDAKDTKADKIEPPKKMEFTPINTATALWTKARNEIKDEEYKQFYKHVSNDFRDPLTWVHNKVEGKLEYISLLFVPENAPFDLWNRDTPRGLKLYVQRVFIMDNVEQFLPLYLRFIKGVIDSNDLPLNVSREILQNDASIEAIKVALTKRVLSMLEKLAKNDTEKYAKFWGTFGLVIKEGTTEDPTNTDKIANLLRFCSTKSESDKQDVSLSQYVERMQKGQDKIYFLLAESYQLAKNSPYLEKIQQQDIEVLLLYDRIDEWLINSLTDYQSKTLQNIAKGDLDHLAQDKKDTAKDDKTAKDADTDKFSDLLKQISTHLGDKIKEARLSSRLTNSPSCIVLNEHELSANMRRIMEASGQKLPEMKPIFEINSSHSLIDKIYNETDVDKANLLIDTLFDQACLLAGLPINHPSEYITRLNKLLLSC